MLNHDRMMNLPVIDGALAAMQVVDSLQRHQPEARILGAAAVFVLLAERFGVSMQDVMGATKKLMNHAEGRRPEFAAIGEYLRHEVR